jgi:hypothetical protein
VSVLRTADLEETVRVLAMLARQEQVGIPEISLIPKRKATTVAEMQRRVVEMLPGCGMVMARDLLQHFGSVRRIVNATEDELRAMPGIGAKKARQIGQVLNAEYEAVDTERNLEDAIEADHSLLFRREVVLLARQHHIYTDEKARHVVDMVFLDPKGDEIILVELKRRRLGRSDLEQLRRYIGNAGQSKMLRSFIEKGTRVRGLLGTVEEGDWRPSDGDVSVTVVNRGRAIEVLVRLRRQWLAGLEAGPGGRRASR